MENFKTKQFNRAKGGAGEGVAGTFLKQRGFELVHNNYINKHGEIDIIAIEYKRLPRHLRCHPFVPKGNTEPIYHFVEVKFRLSTSYGHGRDAVDKYKQQRIRNAAKLYLVQNGLHNRVYCCFDVIEITGTLDNPQIEFLENCF